MKQMTKIWSIEIATETGGHIKYFWRHKNAIRYSMGYTNLLGVWIKLKNEISGKWKTLQDGNMVGGEKMTEEWKYYIELLDMVKESLLKEVERLQILIGNIDYVKGQIRDDNEKKVKTDGRPVT